MRAFKILFFLGAIGFSGHLFAANKFDPSPWNDIGLQCKGWGIQDLDKFIKKSIQWDTKNIQSQNNIVNFYENICPKYLGSANSGPDLDKFVGELQKIYSEITVTKSEAESSERNIDVQIADWNSWLGKAGLKFSDHPCGVRFIERKSYIKAEILRLQGNIENVGVRCPKIAASKTAQAKKGMPSAPSSGPGGAIADAHKKLKPESSDITGTDKKEDQKKK